LKLETTLKQNYRLAELNSNNPNVDRVDLGPNDRIDSVNIENVKSFSPDQSTFFVTDEYKDYAEHPILFLATAWTSTSITVDVTSDLFKEYVTVAIANGEFIARKLSNFMFVDALLRVTIVVQGSSVAQGKLVFSFDPTPYPEETTGDNTHIYFHRPQKTRCMLIPHIEIDPAESKTYTIDLPAPTRYGVYSLAKDNLNTEWSLGSYHMRQTVINTLGSGTAAIPDISIGVFLSLVSPKVSSATTATEFTLTSALLEEKSDASGGVISGFFKKAGEVAGIAAVVTPPNISAPLTLFSAASGAVGNFLSWFGFSKPNVYDPTYATITTQHNWTRVDGKLRSDQLSLRSNNSVGLKPEQCPLMDYNDMITANLCKKPGLVKQFTVATSAAGGSFITSIPVSPQVNRVLDDPAIANAYELTPLSFATYPYGYWRGTIDVDIEFVCSVFHRCTIVALYDPSGQFPAAPPYLRYVSALQHWTFHVNGHTKHRISLPWKQMAPFRDCGAVITAMPSVDRETNGVLWFFLMNPLTTNGSTDPLHVNLYYSSSEMRLGFVTNKTASPVIIPAPEELAGEAPESGAFELTSRVSQDTEFFNKFFGEEHAHSIKELCQRQTRCLITGNSTAGTMKSITMNLFPGPMFFLPTLIGAVNVGTLATNLLAFNAFSFVGTKGSTEYTLWPNQGRNDVFNAAGVSQHLSGGSGQSVSGGTTATTIIDGSEWAGETVAYMAINPSLQANSPFYYRGLFRPSVEGNSNSNDMLEFKMSGSGGTTNAPGRCELWSGAGDDFVFVGYRGTPVIIA
jgi:hypothetical protein